MKPAAGGLSVRNTDGLTSYQSKASIAVVIALAIHLLLVVIGAPFFQRSMTIPVLAGLIFAGPPALFYFFCRRASATRVACSMGLLGFSALIAWMSGGSAASHAHAFAALLALVFLSDARALVAGAVSYLGVCLVAYAVDPQILFPNADPWSFAGLLVLFSTEAVLAQLLASRFARYSYVFLASSSHLKSMAARVADASGEISQSGANLSDGATEQASLASTIGEAIEELTSSVDTTKENLSKTNQLTSSSESNAREGYARMGDMMGAMDEIEENTDKISDIIKAIDEISFQTNILALNAAVEAARAGEAGAGFAVVADEVRGLAQRSATAAKETENLIRVTVESSKKGAGICKEVASSIEQMRSDIGEINTLVSRITDSGSEQFDGIRRVHGDVQRITDITQSNAAVAEQSAAAAQQLKGLADDLNRFVSDIDQKRGADASQQTNFQSSPSQSSRLARREIAPAPANSGEEAFVEAGESVWN